MEDFLGITVLAVTIFLIARWRWIGVIVSVLFGWATIHVINVSFPHDTWSDIEFTEDWPIFGWLWMVIWALVVQACLPALFAIGKWWWADMFKPGSKASHRWTAQSLDFSSERMEILNGDFLASPQS
jgi:hypothetical protein